jgi:hypothetical protein
MRKVVPAVVESDDVSLVAIFLEWQSTLGGPRLARHAIPCGVCVQIAEMNRMQSYNGGPIPRTTGAYRRGHCIAKTTGTY